MAIWYSLFVQILVYNRLVASLANVIARRPQADVAISKASTLIHGVRYVKRLRWPGRPSAAEHTDVRERPTPRYGPWLAMTVSKAATLIQKNVPKIDVLCYE